MMKSDIEEILMFLGLIAASTAFLAGFTILSKVLFVNAALDFLCAIYYVRKELKAEKET